MCGFFEGRSRAMCSQFGHPNEVIRIYLVETRRDQVARNEKQAASASCHSYVHFPPNLLATRNIFNNLLKGRIRFPQSIEDKDPGCDEK